MKSYIFLVLLLSPLAVLCQQHTKTHSKTAKQAPKGSKAKAAPTLDYASILAAAMNGLGDGGLFENMGDAFHDLAGDADGLLRMIHDYTHNPSFRNTVESNLNEFKELIDDGLDTLERWNDPQYPVEFMLAKAYGITLVRNFLRDMDSEYIIRNIDSIAGTIFLLQSKLSEGLGLPAPTRPSHQDL